MATVASIANAGTEPPLLRFPDASRDRITFVAEGDLWTVPRQGGDATRLTHEGGQVFMPRFSPDGTTIAFTWRRGGLGDVWLIGASGGAARRLTHGPSSGPYDNMVTGWSADGREVLFASARRSAFPKREVTADAVSVGGGLARELPMETAGLLSEAGDGHAYAFDRTFRTFGGDRWKRYALINQLRELEVNGLVERLVYSQVPPHVDYSLAERGRSIVPVLTAMEEWGDRNMSVFAKRRQAQAALA